MILLNLKDAPTFNVSVLSDVINVNAFQFSQNSSMTNKNAPLQNMHTLEMYTSSSTKLMCLVSTKRQENTLKSSVGPSLNLLLAMLASGHQKLPAMTKNLLVRVWRLDIL